MISIVCSPIIIIVNLHDTSMIFLGYKYKKDLNKYMNLSTKQHCCCNKLH